MSLFLRKYVLSAFALTLFISFAWIFSTSIAHAEEVSIETNPAPVIVINPELSTDKDDYHPGETATIFGKFFQPLQNVVLKIFGSDDHDQNYTEVIQNLTTDESGSFTSLFNLDNLYRPFYEMVTSNTDGEPIASGWFRDSAIGTYDQCANNLGSGPCNWTNGNLNASNSLYQEGDSTVQRLWIEGFDPGSHSVTFKYGTTKAGKHAYDYLTTWNASENWVTLAERCQGITGCTTTTETAVAMQDDPNAPNTIETPGASRLFTIRGGTITNVSIPTIVTGTYAGDSETIVTVTFTVPSSGDMCTTKKVQGQNVTSCGIAIWFGAHVAKSSQWNTFNGTTGAGSISGSPYHVALDQLDGSSVGSRDNQMSATAIIPSSTITIHKVTTPNASDSTVFNFATNGTGYSNFTLTGGTLNTQTVVGTGSFSVTETSIPANWTNTALTCTASGTGSSATPNLQNHSVAITIGSAGGATIDCIYTNNLVQQANLTLVKTVTKDNGGVALPTDWTLTAAGPTNISGTTGSGAVTAASVNAGVYTLSESGGPSGYTASTWSCTNGITVTNGQITLAAGNTTTCTINNNDQPGTLIVKKTLIKDNGGTAAVTDFSYKVNGGSSVTFEADAQNDMTVNAGTYSVVENSNAGYATTYNNCSNLVIPNGGTATCTITNNDIAPQLTLVKNVINNYGVAALASSWTLLATGDETSISGTTGTANITSAAVNAGTYTLSESGGPFGYADGNWGCSINQGISANAVNGQITLGLGDVATCTVTNTAIAPQLTVIKHVINDEDGSLGASDFTMNVNGTDVSDSSFLGDEAGTTITLDAGEYSVNEADDFGYTASFSTDCSGTIGVGEAKTCTITNDDVDVLPTVTLDKTVDNDSKPEPGGIFNYTLTITNTSVEPVTITALTDSNTLSAGCNDLVGTILAIGASTSCNYSANHTDAGTYPNTASVTVQDDELNNASDIDEVTVTVTDVLPTITVEKTPSVSSVDEPGANVTFTFKVTNTSVEPVEITSLSDDKFGTLAGDDDCKLGTILAIDGSCEFSEIHMISGTGGDIHTNIFTAEAEDNENNKATDTDNAVVNINYVPTLKLVKVVNHPYGGTATAGDWDLTATGISNGFTDDGATGTVHIVTPGIAYTLSETGPSGYSASAWVCTSGNLQGNVLTLATENDATCTITNTDIAPKITVIKHVINNDGDVAVASDFTMHLTGNTLSTNDFAGSETGVEVTLNAGAYIVDEINSAGYTKTLSANCSGTIGVGETKTCTITNDDKPFTTRTQGFWQTHTTYTTGVMGVNNWTIGSKIINSSSILFGGFYSPISKTSTGAKRSALDQARMQMLQQWLAAKLNCQAFGCSAGTQTLLANAATAWVGTNVGMIQSYASQLDAYNNSNDALPISGQGKATPQASQLGANYIYWNTLP